MSTPRPPRSSVGPPQHSLFDGRSARRTHRTVQFATRVTRQFDNRVRDIVPRDGLLLVEMLERALDLYEQRHG